jgi:hypothetical protein
LQTRANTTGGVISLRKTNLLPTPDEPLNHSPEGCDAPNAAVPKRLSEELLELAQNFPQEEIRLKDLMLRFEGRVYTLFLIILSLPFCQPLALPGLSTAFGVVIMLLGLRFALQRQPWLPQRILNAQLPSKLLITILKGGSKVLGFLERLLRPRLLGVFDYRFTQFFGGTTIFLCGFLLLLPLPIPLTNLFPALVVVLVAASFSERDGLMLGAGAAMFVITLLFFAAIFLGGAEAVHWIKDTFGEIFSPGEEVPLFDPLQFDL